MRSALHSAYKKAAEKIMPPLKESGFAERGVLTPDEFVRAGDFLVRTCPTWAWEGGDPSKARPFLPRDKQYLVTRGVPSRRRASAVEGYGSDDGGDDGDGKNMTTVEAGGMEGDDEGWVAPPPAANPFDEEGDLDGGSGGDEEAEEATEKEGEPAASTAEAAAAADPEDPEENDDDDIPDLDDLELVDEDEIDEAALPPAAVAASAAARAKKQKAAATLSESGVQGHQKPHPSQSKNSNSHVVPVRTYDLSISYDKYYQVPRFWLAGFDEQKRPLGAEALLEDVAAEHARKTVTMEPHPHSSSSSSSSRSSSGPSSSSPSPSINVASIHPCRHAAVMKKLASMGAAGGGGGESESERKREGGGEASTSERAEGGGGATLDPESYLVLFLKFISSVIPTIEYDFTMHAIVGGR